MSTLSSSCTILIAFSILFTSNLFKGTNGSRVPLSYSDKRSPPLSQSEDDLMLNYLQSRIDLTVDPCKDFYKFACGKYTDRYMEEQKSLLSVTNKLIDTKDKEDDHIALKMTKQMFRSCLKHESNMEDLKNITAYLGGWALFDPNWKEDYFSFAKFYLKSINIGYLPDSLFTIDIQPHPDTRINIIGIRPLTKSRISLDTENSRNYFTHLFVPKFTRKMQVDSKKMSDEISEYHRMRQRIETINLEPNEYESMSLKDVQSLYGYIPWIEILNVVFKEVKLSINDSVVIDCPRCLKFLNEFLQSTSIKSLVTYLMGSFVFDAILDADDDMMTDWLNYVRGMTREQYCTKSVFTPFRRVIDYEYIKLRRQYYESLIPSITRFIHQLKTTMQNIISLNTFMDSESKGHAIAKVKGMIFKLGYDDEIKSGQVLKYYDKLTLNPESHMLSLFNVKKLVIGKLLESVGKTAKLGYLEATSVNAEHYVFFNTIFLSMNVFIREFFSTGIRPQYFNVGGLGNIIAHEMHHGFDSTGYEFDKKGHMTNWLSKQSVENFFKKLECIENQYSHFVNEQTGNKVDGYKTLDENFCDIGGAEVAYKMYNELSRNEKTKDIKLHRLFNNFIKNFTLPQMFWITTAASFCANPTKEDVLEREMYNVHPIERIRVNGMAMNSEEFSKAWNCNKDTPMNPKEKCTVWK